MLINDSVKGHSHIIGQVVDSYNRSILIYLLLDNKVK